MKIIAGIDLSDLSLDAARSAAKLANKLGDTLLLLRVIDPPAAVYPEVGLSGMGDLEAAVRHANAQALDRLAAALRDEGPAVETRLEWGNPAQALAACAVETGARMIVVGTHGRGAGRSLIGSVAERTALHAPCPVLAVKGGNAPFDAWVRGERPLRIVVGVDRGAPTKAALGWVKALRAVGPCDAVLVHEYWPPAEYARLGLRGPRELFTRDPEVVAVLERELSESVRELVGEGGATLRIEAAWGRIGDALAIEAEETRADLVVVGTQQPHGWTRVAAGSTAVSTLRAARVAVLCVPAAAAAPAAAVPVEVPRLRSVLVATDFSPSANEAVRHAYSLLRAGGTVELCHVHERRVPNPPYLYDVADGALPAETARELEARLRALVPPEADRLGIGTRVHVVDGGEAAEAIAQAARRLGVDAVVVGSHGRTGVRRALLGSVAEGVMRAWEKPTYVVRGGR